MNINVIARSDSAGTDVLGSSGAPQLLNLADTYFDQSGFTDTRDFGDCVWHVTCENKGTATKLTVKIEWSEDASNLSPQGSESISAGVSTLLSTPRSTTLAVSRRRSTCQPSSCPSQLRTRKCR